MNVVVDGVPYAPVSSGSPRFGVAVTTFGRPEVLASCLESVLSHVPPGTPVVVVDDHGSPAAVVPDGVKLVRLDRNLGIPAAKNRCLEELDDLGVDHFFLLDDDVEVLSSDIWRAYMDSPEHHLGYQFPGKDVAKVWDDGRHVAYTGQRGVFLYYSRQAVETVGGFDVDTYERGYYEHVDLAYRINMAGLTTFHYMDVCGSSEMLCSLDETSSVRSSTLAFRDGAAAKHANVFNTRRDTLAQVPFIPYRRARRAVLTSLLSAEADPQRGSKLSATYDSVRKLHTSVAAKSKAEFVLFHDEPVTGLPETVDAVPCKGSGNPYFRRWVYALTWLRDNPGVTHVVICDGTDVEFLQDPFGRLPDDAVVVGEEFSITDDAAGWMRKNHHWGALDRLWELHGTEQMLNAGVVAGRRDLVMQLIHKIVTLWDLYQFDRFNTRRSADKVMIGDMPIFNMAAREGAPKVVHGPYWTTRFKGEEPNDFSAIKHK